jgi:hypothetical protein
VSDTNKNRKPRERERFYLLPGQGGSNFRRKQRQLLALSVMTGVLLASLLGFLMWYFTRLKL